MLSSYTPSMHTTAGEIGRIEASLVFLIFVERFFFPSENIDRSQRARNCLTSLRIVSRVPSSTTVVVIERISRAIYRVGTTFKYLY